MSGSGSTRPPALVGLGPESTHPLVSVVITFHTTDPGFLDEAVRSVLAQTYSRWELILVDDGADERNADQAARFARLDPERIRTVSHAGRRNLGISASRNAGLRLASGRLVAFLDADDVWLPDKLEQQVELFAAHREAGMLYGRTCYWRSWSRTPGLSGADVTPRHGVAADRIYRPPSLLTRWITGEAAVPCMCSVMLRRQTLQAIGGFEERFRGMYEDQAMYAKAASAFPVYVADATWDRYRQHPDSLCAGAARSGQSLPSRRLYLDWLGAYVRSRRIEDAALRRALAQERWLARHPRLGRPVRALRRAKRRLPGRFVS